MAPLAAYHPAAASRPTRSPSSAGREHGRQVRGAERQRLAPAAIAGGPPVTGEHPGPAFTGRAGAAWPDSFARKHAAATAIAEVLPPRRHPG